MEANNMDGVEAENANRMEADMNANNMDGVEALNMHNKAVNVNNVEDGVEATNDLEAGNAQTTWKLVT
jgi:hypothetical protein